MRGDSGPDVGVLTGKTGLAHVLTGDPAYSADARVNRDFTWMVTKVG
jgi:hypothetical protein